MGKRAKQIEGQICFDMCLNEKNFTVQANSLVTGKQTLSLNAAKLLRAAIMQVQKSDEELQPYIITSSELADLLHISKDNIYRTMNEISEELMVSRAEARAENGKRKKFKKINLVSFCEFDSDVGFAIKLNSDLKPYLLNLQNNYTQYTLENILSMNSVYGVRIFEILKEQIKEKKLPINGKEIVLDVQYIRECCDCENKYIRFSQFKARVLDRAIEEINRVTDYQVSYDYVKTGKTISGIRFHIRQQRVLYLKIRSE